jgi:hypothetical protein
MENPLFPDTADEGWIVGSGQEQAQRLEHNGC